MTLLDLRTKADTDETNLWSYDAERCLLGIVLLDPAVLDGLPPVHGEHFRESAHGIIWDTLTDLIAKGSGIDPPTLARRIGPSDPFKDLGGIGYLADLINHAPAQSMAPHFAATVLELASRRAVLTLAETTARELRGSAETAAAIAALESGLLSLFRADGRNELISAADAMRDMLGDLEAPAGSEGGVLTGLASLDEHLGRLQPEELILIAGRPGSGKSALGACIALNVARTGAGVIEINSEMSTRQMMRRHLSDLAFGKWGSSAPTYRDLKRRSLTPGQWGMVEWAAREISALPIAMVKQTGLGLGALRSMVRRQAREWSAKGIEVGLVTVDHAGLLDADTRGRDRYQDQTQIAIGMKALAGELKIPLVCMVQLSRKVEDRDNKRPQLWDLRDSGAWEENADTAIGLFRDAYYALKEKEPKDDGRPSSSLKLDDWSRRRASPTIEAGLMKVREGEETTINLWASIGHNAIRSADPNDGGFL